jgi:hypothetical protein
VAFHFCLPSALLLLLLFSLTDHHATRRSSSSRETRATVDRSRSPSNLNFNSDHAKTAFSGHYQGHRWRGSVDGDVLLLWLLLLAGEGVDVDVGVNVFG